MNPPLDRRSWLRTAGALGLGFAWAGPMGLVGCDRRRETLRLHLDLTLTLTQGGGSPPRLLDGLRMLLVDHLESQGGLTVLPWSTPEGTPDSRSRACFIRLNASLGKAALDFHVDASYANGMKLGPRSSGPLLPAAAFEWLSRNIPFQLRRTPASKLCPAEPDAFRSLVETLAQEDEPEHALTHMALSRELVRRFPDCATSHFLLGNQLYNQLLLHPLDQDSQWKAFQAYGAGLEIVPHHPRGVSGFSLLLADAGLHRDAFSLLEAAIAQHPMVPRLYRSLSYVARTSGLLEIASRALQQVDRLTLGGMTLLSENTYLYLGDFNAFRSTCQTRGVGRDTRFHFYIGYLALLDGDKPGAATAFRASLAVPGGWYGFEDLSGLYLHALEGRPTEAAEQLQALAQKRAALRAPDGEFTFKLAEAAAYLGDRDRAVELGELAYTQGFGCTRWYERSPLFAPARGTARYEALHQHLLKRQALLESSFPRKRFRL